jgi:hypothetical protein
MNRAPFRFAFTPVTLGLLIGALVGLGLVLLAMTAATTWSVEAWTFAALWTVALGSLGAGVARFLSHLRLTWGPNAIMAMGGGGQVGGLLGLVIGVNTFVPTLQGLDLVVQWTLGATLIGVLGLLGFLAVAVCVSRGTSTQAVPLAHV